MEDKKTVRRKALALRDALAPEERTQGSAKIMEQMLKLPCYQEADVILAYVSYRSEVDTFSLIRQALSDGKQVFAPKVEAKEMEFWQINSPDNLKSGYRGILEPEETKSYRAFLAKKKTVKTLMWMPGAAFDRAHHRIGYGGGFYDRYLDGLARENTEGTLTTVALAFDCQVIEKIPSEAHDCKPDLVLTPGGIFY
jgi:5-formyltetrahydrofolate cyclo-ligase